MTKKLKMNKIILALLTLYFFSSCSHKVYDALDWQSTKVTADGKIQEWPNHLRFYDDKSKVNYTISNDRQNLYLCMIVFDEKSQMKIVRSGLEFRIDTTGKKIFSIAFIFPIANQLMMMQHKRNDIQSTKSHNEKSGYAAKNQKLLSLAKDIQLIGFKPPLAGTISLLNSSSGISAAIDIDSSGIMYYEAIIPFRTFYKIELTTSDTNKVFSYEIKVNAIPAPPTHEGGGSGRGMEGGENGRGMEGSGMGGGHHSGGGMHGGEHGGGGEHGSGGGYNSGNSEMFSTSVITKKMKFSFK